MKDGGTRKTNYTKKLGTTFPKTTLSGDVNDECDLSFITPLRNLQPSVTLYAVDDVVIIEVDASDYLIAIGKHGVCGTVDSPKTLLLKRCIQAGNDYKGTILEISGIACKVRIRRRL